MAWLLILAVLQASLPPAPPPRTADPAPRPILVLVLTSPGAERLYHDPGCELVRSGKDVQALSPGKADVLGYKPHTCMDAPPPAAPTTTAGRRPAAPKPPVNDTPVWVSKASNKYHLAGCKAIGSNAKRLTLAEAGRAYWPCPICKPPIRQRDQKGLEVMSWRKKR